MKCDYYRQQLPEWLDGECAPGAADEIGRHLAGCAPCREEAAALKRSLTVFTAVIEAEPEPALPPDLARTIVARARKERPVGRPWRKLVAALIVMAVLSGLYAGYSFRTRIAPRPADRSGLALDSIKLENQGNALEISRDGFAFHTRDKEGKKGVDLKF
jgi:predicted anti-sigma-YlaC factor YlaD